MRKLLPALAIVALASTSAIAQSAPPQPAPAAAAEQKIVKKIVCKRIETDQVSGSRLGSTSKICREVEVPAKEQQPKHAPSENQSH
ncbi:MAG: hypothetical protein H0W39_11855 [Sphingomonas sp.]|nr:hypothetical protein [Sphingomonas sp.]